LAVPSNKSSHSEHHARALGGAPVVLRNAWDNPKNVVQSLAKGFQRFSVGSVFLARTGI